MHTYTLKSVSPLGEYDETYGQSWWAVVNETSVPVMFNTKAVSVSANARITAEEQEEKQGKKGPFLRLKKVKVEGGEPKLSPTNSIGIPPSDIQVQLDRIEKKLDSLLSGEPIKEDHGQDTELPFN